jgi:hypothetical protein
MYTRVLSNLERRFAIDLDALGIHPRSPLLGLSENEPTIDSAALPTIVFFGPQELCRIWVVIVHEANACEDDVPDRCARRQAPHEDGPAKFACENCFYEQDRSVDDGASCQRGPWRSAQDGEPGIQAGC